MLYGLTQAVGPWGTIQYIYDPVGNRTVETTGTGMTNYKYGANKLLSSTGVKPYSFGYDNNGNTIAESRPLNAERSFTYNQNQRLIKAVEGNKILGEYVYNGNGQRVKKTVNGKTTYFFYDQSGNLLEEADGEGNPIADYIYLGGTPIGRVDMNKDNMPPVTAVSVGAPTYQNAESLYVSGNTLITLSASDPGDNPSGVDYTEYRIDDNVLWTAYIGPFKLGNYSDGVHKIYYRSIDKAGNLEDSKTLTVILDTTAPVSGISVGSPQFEQVGNLYVGGSTPITITSSDSGSGVGKIEYAVDEGAYDLFAGAFTLSTYSDGQHIIRYRTTDNVLNVEAEKKLTVTLDKTPPVTTIFASDELYEGVTNTVSPKTRFFLESTDDSVGIKEVLYRVDDGIWSTYLAGFPLPGVAGGHTIGYRAIDNLGNEESEKVLSVNMIVVDVTKEVSTGPIVLAGAWGSTPSTVTAIANLTSILSASGLSYYIPQTEADFKTSLRAGKYNTYLLVDFKTNGLVDELREAVNYGDGLVYIKTLPDTIPSLQDVFGVKFNGMSTNKDMVVSLAESGISHAATLQSAGKAVRTIITSPSAQSLGTVTDKKETWPVVIANEYGRGKVVLFAFDLLTASDQNKAASLITNSINYVIPVEHYTRSLGNEPIKITLQNSTEPVDVRVTESIPANTSVASIIPSATQSGNTITWLLSLGSNEKKAFGYSLTLPDAASDYQLGTELRYSNQGDYRLYGNYGLSVTVLENSSELLRQAIADLNGLQVSSADAGHVNNAFGYLNAVRDYTGITQAAAQNNISYILSALSELSKVSVEVTTIRLKLDELLKIWQTKWSLATAAISQVSRYKLAYETAARKIERKVAQIRKPLLLAAVGSTTGLLTNQTSNDVLYFYHTDHLGTPIMMTDNNGSKVWEGEFLPFGEEYSITGTATNNLRFPGQYYDEETGLHQNWHRDYKSEIGKYIEQDPLGFKGGMNLFNYTDNNPVNLTDPTGTNIYGNWCGPGGCGPIKNSVDQCCKEHDECYAKGGASAANNVFGIGKQQCVEDCDKKLCKCLKNYKPENSDEEYGRMMVMLWFKCY